jgi:alpha-D-ribose 1-methylphosphonate 5-triphosphate synthase subunit PhnG
MTATNEANVAIRREVMAVLSQMPTAEIAACLAQIAVPAHEELRAPEDGLVMLRGRIGGDGAPFNLGEASVARAAVRLAGGEVGFGYTLGRDGEKARLIALCDALIQSSGYRADVERHVVLPLKDKLAAARAEKAAETAATRVDFYTLVRGEN